MESLSVTRGSRPLYRIRNRKSQRIHRDDDPRSPAGLVAQRCVDLLHQRLDQPLSEGPALGVAVGPDADTVVGDRKLDGIRGFTARSEEHTSELQSLMRISYAVFCLKKKK